MEDQVYETQETGVEEVPAAEEQSAYESNDEQNTSSSEETGVESSDAAGQIRDEKDFSAALKAREAQIRKQIEQEYAPYKQQNAYLDELAQMSGYTNRDEFISAVNEAKQRQQHQREAQRLGIDEDSYRQYIAPVNQEVQQLRNELHNVKYQETTRQIEGEVNQLRQKYEDFDKYLDPVFDMAISRGYSLEDAYRLASYEDRMSNVTRQTEQEVLARVTGRDEKQVIPSNDKPSNSKLDVASMSFDDIEALSARVRRGERIQL